MSRSALVDGCIGLVDIERWRLRLGQDLEVRGAELDLAGRELLVLGAGQAFRDRAAHGQDELRADAAGLLVGGRVFGLVDDDLGDPVAVAQVQEDQLAVVASPMDPAREAGVGARVGCPQLPVGMSAVGRGETAGGCIHGRRIVVDHDRRPTR